MYCSRTTGRLGPNRSRGSPTDHEHLDPNTKYTFKGINSSIAETGKWSVLRSPAPPPLWGTCWATPFVPTPSGSWSIVRPRCGFLFQRCERFNIQNKHVISEESIDRTTSMFNCALLLFWNTTPESLQHIADLHFNVERQASLQHITDCLFERWSTQPNYVASSLVFCSCFLFMSTLDYFGRPAATVNFASGNLNLFCAPSAEVLRKIAENGGDYHACNASQ